MPTTERWFLIPSAPLAASFHYRRMARAITAALKESYRHHRFCWQLHCHHHGHCQWERCMLVLWAYTTTATIHSLPPLIIIVIIMMNHDDKEKLQRPAHQTVVPHSYIILIPVVLTIIWATSSPPKYTSYFITFFCNALFSQYCHVL